MKKKTIFEENKKFKYENDFDFNPEEVEAVKSKSDKDVKRKVFDQIHAKKNEAFVETMEDDDKATKYIADTERANIKRAREQKDEALNFLDLSQSYPIYRTNAAERGMWILMNKSLPIGYEYHCVPTTQGILNIYGKAFNVKDGIIFVLKDRAGKIFIKAMHCTYDPVLDDNAIVLLCNEVENTIEFLERQKKEKENATLKGIVDKYGKPTGTSKKKIS